MLCTEHRVPRYESLMLVYAQTDNGIAVPNLVLSVVAGTCTIPNKTRLY
jgi:hypothetical protein